MLSVVLLDDGFMNPLVDSQFSFSNPTLLPLRSVDTIATNSVLVVAPHPDDETLGCGGAIALLRALGCSVQVLVISDGTLSHPRSVKYPAPCLRILRETETLEALSILGMNQIATFLRLQDGSIPILKSPRLQEAVARCRAFLKTLMPATIFLPWRFDPHPDHRATWQLIRTALIDLEPPKAYAPRILEYPIWDWDVEQRRGFAGEQVIGWRLDVSSVLEIKLRAIAAYRSQTTDLIDDDPEGFRLTPEMLANFAQPWELYLEEV
ncbi:PIG-L family deacetylase [Phormidium sp. CLA17]|uniref:PIG-L deacetylase family protein n=1 Tax=Leptolyngbya sp. Cla-17 TaxID=2803751 RepID=UPI001931B2C1|nr:PIG-L deacetylase family protein [Leptolyngbya sp. Cla-17]MBM0743431.1 PIG-L family deacetylase [Leptolyngbya sp. Cla-17]